MILYLSSNENLSLFDFLKEEQNMLVEKLSGEFSLKKFIVHETRTFNHYRYIIIDLNAVNDPANDIVEALKALKIMYDARIILFAGKSNIDLLNKLIDEASIYNIIFGKTINKIKEQAKICISQKGMTKHSLKININLNYDENKDIETIFNSLRSNLSTDLNEQLTKDKLVESIRPEDKFNFNARDIKIIISGAMPRVGTTTTSINMACYLANMGARVSYTEGNRNNHLQSIHSHFFFNNPIANNFFTGNGVDYYFDGNIPAEGYNFNIIDIGVLNQQNIKLLNEMGEVKILCGGIKPYEIKEVKKTLELVDNKNVKLILPKDNSLNIKQTLSIEDEQIYYAKLSLNLFDSNINAEIFGLILDEYIVKPEILRAL